MNEEKIVKLMANKYGYEAQSRQCVEELSELIQTICKDKRQRTAASGNSEIIKPINKLSNTGKDIVEKITDVEIVLDQLKVLMNCENEVKEAKSFKLNSQFKNMH